MTEAWRATRPEAGDFHPFYAGYVERVPDGDIVATLRNQWSETERTLRSVPGEAETFRYAPGKWSIREVVGHLVDAERVFSFRTLWMARGAEGALPGMDQDAWVGPGGAGERPLADLVVEWGTVRRSTLDLLESLDEAAWMRTGTASGFPFRVRALPWIMAGHERHHLALLGRDYGVEAV